jgi:hypothetical protein
MSLQKKMVSRIRQILDTLCPYLHKSSMTSIIGTRPENTGLAIFVSTSAFFKTMHRVLGEVIPEVPTSYLLVTNEAEAYQRFEDWFASQSTDSSD